MKKKLLKEINFSLKDILKRPLSYSGFFYSEYVKIYSRLYCINRRLYGIISNEVILI